MSATVLAPIKLALTGTPQDLTPLTPVGKVRSYDVRFANVGSANSFADVILTDGTVVITRAKEYPVPYRQAGSAPDVERLLVVPAGWKLQAKAAASLQVEASVTGVEADAADFA